MQDTCCTTNTPDEILLFPFFILFSTFSYSLFTHYAPVPESTTVFLWSDVVATIYFAAHFVWLLFEGGYYLRAMFISFGVHTHQWRLDKIYVWVRRWWLLDTVSSTCSLSVLLSAVGRTRRTQTVLALVWWALSEIIRTCVCIPHLLPAATIRGRCSFRSRASDWVASIWGWLLFKEIR